MTLKSATIVTFGNTIFGWSYFLVVSILNINFTIFKKVHVHVYEINLNSNTNI